MEKCDADGKDTQATFVLLVLSREFVCLSEPQEARRLRLNVCFWKSKRSRREAASPRVFAQHVIMYFCKCVCA